MYSTVYSTVRLNAFSSSKFHRLCRTPCRTIIKQTGFPIKNTTIKTTLYSLNVIISWLNFAFSLTCNSSMVHLIVWQRNNKVYSSWNLRKKNDKFRTAVSEVSFSVTKPCKKVHKEILNMYVLCITMYVLCITMYVLCITVYYYVCTHL